MRLQRAELPLKLDGLLAARAFFAGCFAERDPALKSLFVAHVDDQARCVHLTLHEDDGNEGALPISTIIADAAEHRSAGIVLAHNHPGGDPAPSKADRSATLRLRNAAEALDCTLIDHVIFGGEAVTSLRRLGHL